MNQSFYTGAVGARQQMQNLNVQANNLANINTYGYKAQVSRFTSLFHQRLDSISGQDTSNGVGTCMLMTSTSHAQGAPLQTGRRQDYCIDGNGYFALVDLATNQVTFTRNGAFTVAPFERATDEVDENGNPIMETVMALTDGEGRFVLGRNGDLIIVTEPFEAQDIGIFDFGNYDGMEHLDGTEFLPVDKNGNLYYGTGNLMQGYLEGSNVDFADSMTKLIEAQRAYSMALKMLQTSDEIENTINNLR